MQDDEKIRSEDNTGDIELPPLLPFPVTEEDYRRLDARFNVANRYPDSATQFLRMLDAIATAEHVTAERETQLRDELQNSRRLNHQVNLLGEAIGKIAVALGVTSGDLHLTGPQALFLAEAVVSTISHSSSEAGWIGVEEALPPNRENVEIRGRGYYGDGWRDLQSRLIECVTHWKPSGESTVPEQAPPVGRNREHSPGSGMTQAPAHLEPEIQAEAHSDDRIIKVSFLANPWFSSATEQEILHLAAIDWGGDEAADIVAEDMAGTNRDLALMFDYIHLRNRDKNGNDTIGFEVHVDQDSAMAWLREHRPAQARKLEEKA